MTEQRESRGSLFFLGGNPKVRGGQGNVPSAVIPSAVEESARDLAVVSATEIGHYVLL